MIAAFEDHPLVDGSEYLEQPLFWLCHLRPLLVGEEIQELAFGADWEAAGEFEEVLRSPDAWPVFTVPVRGGRVIHVVCCNFDGDASVDFFLHDPTGREDLWLVTLYSSARGPGLSWRELDAIAADARVLTSPAGWGPVHWRERDGTWICDGADSYRCPDNDFSHDPEELAAVSAALGGG